MVHVYVALEKDDKGYPPYDAEELDAVPVEGDRFRIEGIPVWVYGLARGDVVRVVGSRADGKLWVTEVLEEGGHWTTRILPADAGSLDAVAARFAALGCEAWATRYGLVAVDVPPTADTHRVMHELEEGARGKVWEYDLGVAPT